MGTVKTKDGTEIFYKDWGQRAAHRLHHGWPLCADDWDTSCCSSGPGLPGHRARPPRPRPFRQPDAGHDMDTTPPMSWRWRGRSI